ncbi:MAG: ComF family protein, partial [Clostridium sp.]
AYGGNRGRQVHIDSMKVINESKVKGKNIVVFDDVTTTGNTLAICKILLLEAGAKSVTCCALAKTIKPEITKRDIYDSNNLTKLDDYLQTILDKKLKSDMVVESLIDKYNDIKNIFDKMVKYVKRLECISVREIEVYIYMLKQCNLLYKVSDLEKSIEKLDFLKYVLCDKLVIYYGITEYLSDYIDITEYLGRKCRQSNCFKIYLDNFNIKATTNICSPEFSMEYYSYNRINNGNLTIINYFQIAEAYYKLEPSNYGFNSLRHIDYAIKEDSNNRILHYNKALILCKCGDITDAVNEINKASCIEYKCEHELYWFCDGKSQIEKLLRDIHKLLNSHESNLWLTNFLLDHRLGFDVGSISRRLTRFLKIKKIDINLTDLELEVKGLILASNKMITDEEIVNKSEENINCKLLDEILKDKVYRYNKTIIDKEYESEHYEADDIFIDDNGPDWLGGVETEAEFWEHT